MLVNFWRLIKNLKFLHGRFIAQAISAEKLESQD